MRILLPISLALVAVGCQSPAPVIVNAGLPDGQTILVRKVPLGAAALSNMVPGSVTVEFDITAEGKTENAVVTASEPEGVFDREALRQVQRLEWRPKTVDGRPVRQRASQTLDFAPDAPPEPDADTSPVEDN